MDSPTVRGQNSGVRFSVELEVRDDVWEVDDRDTPRVVATAIPTRPVSDPSLRILRLRRWSRSVEDKGLLLGSQRW